MASFFPDDVETVDGVTPGTVGLEVLAADTAAEGRTALALGTIATETATAGGDLAGTWPSPTVTQARGLRETGASTTLAMGAVPAASFLQRVGTNLVGTDPYSPQTIAGDTTLTTQRALLWCTAAAKITLPAVSTWAIGMTTRVVYRGTSAVTIELIADAADQIEGSDKVGLYGTDIVAEFVVTAANKVECNILRGTMAWLHCLVDLTAAAGASPWSLTTNNGDSTTWTDRSSASNSVAASSGLVHTSTTGSYYTSNIGSIVTTTLAGLLDSWDRPWVYTDRVWILSEQSRTTGSSNDAVPILTLGGSTVATVPKITVSNSTGGFLELVTRVVSTTAAYTSTVARTNSANWMGFLLDTPERKYGGAMLSTSPSGDPGVDWWPWTYEGLVGVDWPQNLTVGPWIMGNCTNLDLVQVSVGTSNDKFTRTTFAVLQVRYGDDR